ncbi:phage major capsid protein [Xanthobacter sediminis]|uniref:phage major capsid protein n=1 Tax=Xanthobacter sediminis TaxID=3119926 RepID=UPI0037261BC9
MLDAFFDPEDGTVRSIRECYVTIIGDKEVTGRPARANRFTEALNSTAFPEVLGDAMQRRMLADYRNPGIYDVWRDLANIVPVGDFREQNRVRYGGYGDLPIVAEAGPYAPVDSPTDEKAAYKVAKRGGTETVTLEMIKNDDVGAVTQVPIRMSRAAKRTLSKFVLDFLRLNTAIYDGKALFHTDHGNLGSAALAAPAIAAARIAMKAQKEKDSAEPLGIPPRFLWVPDALEQTAFDLFRLGTNNEANFIQSLQWQIRPVWYWADTNDWCLPADKGDIPSVEIGFLHGKEEPEIFIQDNKNAGSLFTNDVITYKIRHIYGGTVTDFRDLYKAVVA